MFPGLKQASTSHPPAAAAAAARTTTSSSFSSDMARASAAFLLRGGEGRVFERKAGSIESWVPVDDTVEAMVLSAKASCAGVPVDDTVEAMVLSAKASCAGAPVEVEAVPSGCVVEWAALEGECAVASLLRSVENRRRVLFWRRERHSAGRFICEMGASSFKCREEAWFEKER